MHQGKCNVNLLNAYITGTPSGTPAVTYYAYDSTWKDKLISNGGYPLTYDAIGNLSTYGGWEYTWEAGRRLKRQVQNSTVVEYEYDSSGMRVRKTYKHTSGYVWSTSNYTYNGKLLAHLEKNGDNMHFYYDAQGRPAMVDYNGTKYHYLHNLQGDVIGLVDTSGNLVVEYKYNAWGSILGTSTLSTAYSSLASMNPFRYRGYVYDEETWMYYCRARYYYPELQRWINADALLGKIGALFSHNLFAYCRNNPAVRVDYNGYADWNSSTAIQLITEIPYSKKKHMVICQA